MWKRDEVVRPANPGSVGTKEQSNSSGTTATVYRTAGDATRSTERGVVNIGKSVIVKGELNGSENLTIEGQVEGKIELLQHVLTIGPNGKIKAQVFAKSVIVVGEVTGNITATEIVNIRENGKVDGDIAAPRVAIAEGAHFRGSIDMQRQGGAALKAVVEDKPAGKVAAATPSAAARAN